MASDKPRPRLLYNNIVDVWIDLCKEKGWNWSDRQLHNRFIRFLQEESISLQKLPVCPPEGGEKGDVAKRISILLGDPSKSFVLRTDAKTVEKLRSFAP